MKDNTPTDIVPYDNAMPVLSQEKISMNLEEYVFLQAYYKAMQNIGQGQEKFSINQIAKSVGISLKKANSFLKNFSQSSSMQSALERWGVNIDKIAFTTSTLIDNPNPFIQMKALEFSANLLGVLKPQQIDLTLMTYEQRLKSILEEENRDVSC